MTDEWACDNERLARRNISHFLKRKIRSVKVLSYWSTQRPNEPTPYTHIQLSVQQCLTEEVTSTSPSARLAQMRITLPNTYLPYGKHWQSMIGGEIYLPPPPMLLAPLIGFWHFYEISPEYLKKVLKQLVDSPFFWFNLVAFNIIISFCVSQTGPQQQYCCNCHAYNVGQFNFTHLLYKWYTAVQNTYHIMWTVNIVKKKLEI